MLLMAVIKERACVVPLETAEIKQLWNRFQEDLGHCASQSQFIRTQPDGWSCNERENNPPAVRLRVKCYFRLAKVHGKCLVRTTLTAADLQVQTRPEGVSSKGWLWASQQPRCLLPGWCLGGGQLAAPLLPSAALPLRAGPPRGQEAGAAGHPPDRFTTSSPGSELGIWCGGQAPLHREVGERTPGLSE